MKTCGEILRLGEVGQTVDDETPTKVCGSRATWRVSAPDVRPKYRCDEHVAVFRAIGDIRDLVIEPAE